MSLLQQWNEDNPDKKVAYRDKVIAVEDVDGEGGVTVSTAPAVLEKAMSDARQRIKLSLRREPTFVVNVDDLEGKKIGLKLKGKEDGSAMVVNIAKESWMEQHNGDTATTAQKKRKTLLGDATPIIPKKCPSKCVKAGDRLIAVNELKYDKSASLAYADKGKDSKGTHKVVVGQKVVDKIRKFEALHMKFELVFEKLN